MVSANAKPCFSISAKVFGPFGTSSPSTFRLISLRIRVSNILIASAAPSSSRYFVLNTRYPVGLTSRKSPRTRVSTILLAASGLAKIVGSSSLALRTLVAGDLPVYSGLPVGNSFLVTLLDLIEATSSASIFAISSDGFLSNWLFNMFLRALHSLNTAPKVASRAIDSSAILNRSSASLLLSSACNHSKKGAATSYGVS